MNTLPLPPNPLRATRPSAPLRGFGRSALDSDARVPRPSTERRHSVRVALFAVLVTVGVVALFSSFSLYLTDPGDLDRFGLSSLAVIALASAFGIAGRPDPLLAESSDDR